jgi:hypothetical protein
MNVRRDSGRCGIEGCTGVSLAIGLETGADDVGAWRSLSLVEVVFGLVGASPLPLAISGVDEPYFLGGCLRRVD